MLVAFQTELPAATRPGPVATVTASWIPEDTSGKGPNDDQQLPQSLLQDITGIFSLLQTSSPTEHFQTSATLLTLGVVDKLLAKMHAGEYIKCNYPRSFGTDSGYFLNQMKKKDPIKTIWK